jgi:hypothetical protein
MKQVGYVRSIFVKKLLTIKYYKSSYDDGIYVYSFYFNYANYPIERIALFKRKVFLDTLKELFSDDTKILLSIRSEVGEICKRVIVDDIKYFTLVNDD